jgi:6-phosphogluconolactonase
VFAHVGTWPGVKAATGAGIYSFRVDSERGDLEEVGCTEVPEPSHLAVSTNGCLYTASHTSKVDGRPGCAAYAYRIDPESGRLLRLNHLLLSATHACHVSLDSNQRSVFVAAGMGGTIFSLRVGEDGRLKGHSSVVPIGERPLLPLGEVWESIDQPFPAGPADSTPHCMRVTPSNRFVLVCDLVANRVRVFGFESETGELTRHAAGSIHVRGARHLAIHPEISVAYVCEESSNAVTVLQLNDKDGTLATIQRRPCLPASFRGDSATADIHVHPSGRWVYVSNRGHDTLAAFAIDRATGMLGSVEWYPAGGRTPRGFAIAPSGRLVLVANQDSSTIDAHFVQSDGSLSHVGAAAVPTPTSVVFWETASKA